MSTTSSADFASRPCTGSGTSHPVSRSPLQVHDGQHPHDTGTRGVQNRVTTNGWMKAIDLSTDQIAWTFNGESAPVERSRGAASGCCERPWTLPDGKTLLVGSVVVISPDTDA
jgi:hypothetical protein